MAKMKVPDGTFEESLNLDSKRPFPSMECLDKKELDGLTRRINKLMDFHSGAKLAYQAAESVSKWLLEKDFEKREVFDDFPAKSDKYFYLDPWQKSSIIVVREGKKPITEGFRIINSHADAPCLKVKPRPIRMKWDPDDIYNYLGVRLSTIPHGGISVPHWIGQPVKVIGYTIGKNGKRKEIAFPGFIGVTSTHIDYSDSEEVSEAFSPEKSLEVLTGYSTPEALLKQIGLENSDDFANTHLWAVPTHSMLPVDETTWNLLVGYGHDNRTSVFSLTDAIIKAKNPTYTSFAWISDNEEVGETPPAGTEGPFFEAVLEKMLEKQAKEEKRTIPELEKIKMYKDSKFILGDVTLAPYGIDAENMDFLSAVKVGLGAGIEVETVPGANPRFVRYLRDLASETKSRKKICHQVAGESFSQDKRDMWYSCEAGRLTKKGISMGYIGVPCASLHSLVEIICPGDEYATSELYKRFFEGNKLK